MFLTIWEVRALLFHRCGVDNPESVLFCGLFEAGSRFYTAYRVIATLTFFILDLEIVDIVLTMSLKPSARQSSPFFLKRVKYFFSRLFGTRLQKAKSIHFVTVNGHRYKRLILCDSYLAHQIEQNLNSFIQSGYFPSLVARYEHEIWLEYVEGVSRRSVDEEFVLKIAEFYATVYRTNSTLLDTKQSSFPDRLLQDLCFLHQIGVLDQSSLPGSASCDPWFDSETGMGGLWLYRSRPQKFYSASREWTDLCRGCWWTSREPAFRNRGSQSLYSLAWSSSIIVLLVSCRSRGTRFQKYFRL